ncbi:nucleoside triphosphate pyrophosphohydrolase [Dehalogenimonas etheniformans]|uniref:Nucleoside triphosphate pyrophosphohydrolase n=1 Tax=Dehalogenimonas etheniformans TaxID=1536648 RepID=A0A2P5P6B0_9CHLR|nr:nucleoside triphosphate pyrophosphohydrolase [Dehalogenimonas etheniformans]PPD57836.1 nucleoside triphosphate pyrophosphohydrolase [Dehalogenimonas etheniformans]QNT75510.1 nucleoside triphosphate pyrophosphohydrolase [Dehalogenimonas etheniformans]
MPDPSSVPEQDASDFQTLVNIIDRLRAPDGCPWDREQTHLSVRDSLLEECYEVLEAIDSGDKIELKTELGDLLMQVVFHSKIAAENGDFTIGNVIEGIVTKLIRRHPHVFGDREAKDAGEVLRRWEDIKKAEKPTRESMLDGVPIAMPALAYSEEVQGRVARVGFDWKDDQGVIDKLVEEIAELKEAATGAEREAEFGDVLFTLVNYARRQGIDAESALRGANHKFAERFKAMEGYCTEKGISFKDLTFDQQNEIWEKVKEQT